MRSNPGRALGVGRVDLRQFQFPPENRGQTDVMHQVRRGRVAHPFAWFWRRVGRSVRWFLELCILQFGNYSHSFPLPCEPVRLNLHHAFGFC